MTKLISQILSDAADLIEPEGAWTQGMGARRVDSRRTDPLSAKACSWCLAGAIERVAPNPGYAEDAWVEVRRHTSRDSQMPPTVWSDHPDRKQSEVVELLRKVSNELKEKGK